MIIFFKQPGLGALGQWGACSRQAASSAVGGIKNTMPGQQKEMQGK